MTQNKKCLFVFLSYSNSPTTKNYTLNAIISLMLSSKNSSSLFGICVVETNANENWDCLKPFVHVVHPKKKFNYNEFANIGVKSFKINKPEFEFDFICLCNNDLYFHKGFYEPLVKHSFVDGFDSLSPRCSISDSNKYLEKISKNSLPNRQTYIEGYVTASQLNGWCLFLKKETYETIGGFDEDFSFWCADDSYREQLLQNNLKHAVLIDSIVDHLDFGSNTLKTLGNESLNQEYTTKNLDKYRKKFNRT